MTATVDLPVFADEPNELGEFEIDHWERVVLVDESAGEQVTGEDTR